MPLLGVVNVRLLFCTGVKDFLKGGMTMQVVYVIVSLIICFVYFQFLDWALMDAQGLDYFYMFR